MLSSVQGGQKADTPYFYGGLSRFHNLVHTSLESMRRAGTGWWSAGLILPFLTVETKALWLSVRVSDRDSPPSRNGPGMRIEIAGSIVLRTNLLGYRFTYAPWCES